MILINLLVIFLFSVYVAPCFLRFISKYTDQLTLGTILSTFFGSLIGLNTSYLFFKFDFARNIYKNELLENYRDYQKVINLILNCLCEKDKFKLFVSNFIIIDNTISKIDGFQFQNRIAKQISIDRENLKELMFLIDKNIQKVKDYLRYFYNFNETDCVKYTKELYRIMDIYFGKDSVDEKIEKIQFYFSLFENEKCLKTKSAKDFFYWFGNYDSIENVIKITNKIVKKMKTRKIIIDYNFSYVNKKVRMNNYRDV